MNVNPLTIDATHMQKLLHAANADAALLYLYIRSGNDPAQAEQQLHMHTSRVQCALAILRQLDLLPQSRPAVTLAGERPRYSETDVLQAMNTDNNFRTLYGEVQRLLGKSLNTEELKILLGFVRYLGLPENVISVLVCYCKDRAKQKGNLRTPSLRTIEKEAYLWAEQGIDTLEEAAAFIQRQTVRHSRMGHLMQILQIRGRNLTAGEERYAQQWLDMGFDDEALAMAYERTCLNTGGLSWAYMNKILQRWQQGNLLTGQQIRSGDRGAVPKGASGQLGQAELEAIEKVLREG